MSGTQRRLLTAFLCLLTARHIFAAKKPFNRDEACELGSAGMSECNVCRCVAGGPSQPNQWECEDNVCESDGLWQPSDGTYHGKGPWRSLRIPASTPVH